MKKTIKHLLRGVIDWVNSPEAGELSDLEIIQAEKLAMSNCVEILANMLIRSNGLMTKDLVATQFRSHASSVVDLSKEKDKNEFEKLSLQITAATIDDIASNILGGNDEKED